MWLLGDSIRAVLYLAGVVAAGPLRLHLHKKLAVPRAGTGFLPSTAAGAPSRAGPTQSASRREVCGGSGRPAAEGLWPLRAERGEAWT